MQHLIFIILLIPFYIVLLNAFLKLSLEGEGRNVHFKLLFYAVHLLLIKLVWVIYDII